MSVLTVQAVRELASEGLAKLLPAAVQIGERAGVILRQIDSTQVELYHVARITRVAITDLDFESITEPTVQAAVYAEAVEALTICRRVAFEAEAAQRRVHAGLLDSIREYAITRHEDGEICRDGLDEFLVTFGFEPYCPRLRVDYTISGSYEVVQHDASFAENDARDYLRPDLSSLDDVDGDSSVCEVTVDVTAL